MRERLYTLLVHVPLAEGKHSSLLYRCTVGAQLLAPANAQQRQAIYHFRSTQDTKKSVLALCSLLWCVGQKGKSPETKPVGGPRLQAFGRGCGAALVLTLAWYLSWQPRKGNTPLPVVQPPLSGHHTQTLQPVVFLHYTKWNCCFPLSQCFPAACKQVSAQSTAQQHSSELCEQVLTCKLGSTHCRRMCLAAQ